MTRLCHMRHRNDYSYTIVNNTFNLILKSFHLWFASFFSPNTICHKYTRTKTFRLSKCFFWLFVLKDKTIFGLLQKCLQIGRDRLGCKDKQTFFEIYFWFRFPKSNYTTLTNCIRLFIKGTTLFTIIIPW